MPPWRIILALSVATLTSSAFAQTCRATSDARVRPLVELYTSEGCNSCPPADRWLGSRFAARDIRAVPLAFHVDYWDRLGWVDRFASPAYTARQYASMRANRATFVYTPQVLVQGRDFAAWQARGDATIDAAALRPARAVLEASATPSRTSVVVDIQATIDKAALRDDARVFVAFVDSGLHSDVRAGENRGVRLSHDHVVRSLHTSGPPDARGRIDMRVDIARPVEAGTSPAIVAFVQRASNGDVLQTLPLPLDGCGGS